MEGPPTFRRVMIRATRIAGTIPCVFHRSYSDEARVGRRRTARTAFVGPWVPDRPLSWRAARARRHRAAGHCGVRDVLLPPLDDSRPRGDALDRRARRADR